MRLIDLEPKFVRYETRDDKWERVVGDPATWKDRGMPTEEVEGKREYTIIVESLAEAQGIWLLCPKCFAAKGDHFGIHSIDVSFADRGVLDHQGSHGKDGKPTRWTVSGSGFADLTTHPSIQLEGGCAWHGYISNGEAS